MQGLVELGVFDGCCWNKVVAFDRQIEEKVWSWEEFSNRIWVLVRSRESFSKTGTFYIKISSS